MTSAANETSHDRLKAEGFPLAPLTEAVLAIYFADGLSADESEGVAKALATFYPECAPSEKREFVYDADGGGFEAQGCRTSFRMEGADDTEVAQILPEGLAVSQLAPYRSWDVLFKRLARDFDTTLSIIGDRPVSRLATRFINRIDVPLVNDIAEYEQYLATHIALPKGIPVIGDFYFRFGLPVPEIDADATIQSGALQPAVEGKASFALDIDLFRVRNLPTGRSDILSLFDGFRAAKNRLYEQFLTEKALEEFK